MLKSWLSAGPVDRSVGDGLMFVASEAGARVGKGSWILRYRFGGRQKEKVLGRYPEITLRTARELALRDRAQIQQGVDVAVQKRLEKLRISDAHNVESLASAWYERDIAPKYKRPEAVERAIRRHIKPVIGKLPVEFVRPVHIDEVLTRIVAAGAPTVANDVRRYLLRMFHFAVKRKWIDSNPAYGFEVADAGGTEQAKSRWLTTHELQTLAERMRSTPNFGRQNELAVWLLLALCVRKMELLSAKWSEFDLPNAVWMLMPSRTKTNAAIRIPLPTPVIEWLNELKVFAFGSDYLFPARLLVRERLGRPQSNRHSHVSPDTLNVALKRLPMTDFEHFTVHDMRRTARTHMAVLGIDRFVAERALNHKLKDVEGVYNQYDYFKERKVALEQWAALLSTMAVQHPPDPAPCAAAAACGLPADGLDRP